MSPEITLKQQQLLPVGDTETFWREALYFPFLCESQWQKNSPENGNAKCHRDHQSSLAWCRLITVHYLHSMHIGGVWLQKAAASGRFVLEHAQLCLLLSCDCSSSGRAQQFGAKMAHGSALWGKLLPQSSVPHKITSLEVREALQPLWSSCLALTPSLLNWEWQLHLFISSIRDQQTPSSKMICSEQEATKSWSPFQQGKSTQSQGSHQIAALEFDNTVQKPCSSECAIRGGLDAASLGKQSQQEFLLGVIGWGSRE